MNLLRTLVDTAFSSVSLLNMEHPSLRHLTRGRKGNHRGSDSRHLALFAPMPPHTGAGVYRPLSFMQYGARHGWRIDAFAGPAPDNESEHGAELLARVPTSARLHIVPPPSRQPSYNFFPRVDGGFTKAIAHAEFAIDVLRDDPPDLVLASGPPFFTFVAARFVARHFDVPFVLDYRDEWTECPFDFVNKDGDDLKWERRCLADADAVLFVTESLLRHQLGVFQELDPQRGHVVRNGWDPDDFASASRDLSRAPHQRTAVLRLAHVGNLAGHTPPFEFLESLRQLLSARPEWISRLKVSFIGRRSESADAAFRAFPYPDVLELTAHVGKREAIRRMYEADVLLLLSAPDLDRSLPSKLFEYIASRRPVLIFGSPGESSTLIEKLSAGMLCPSGSGEALGDALMRSRDLDMSPFDQTVSAWLQNHRRDALAARAFEIFESVMVDAPSDGDVARRSLSEARAKLARHQA
jgi:glycosyltransferase involved in cell wall biosynthesis